MTFIKWRKQNHPEMRRTSPVAIIHSGGLQTIFGCLCGAKHTCATNYRQARHVSEWRSFHNKNCMPVEVNI